MKIKIADIVYETNLEISKEARAAIENSWKRVFEVFSPIDRGNTFEPPVKREIYLKTRLYAARVEAGDVFIDGHNGALCRVVPSHKGVAGEIGPDSEDGLVRKHQGEDGKESLIVEKPVMFYKELPLTIPLLAVIATKDLLGASPERDEIDFLLNALTDRHAVFTGGGIVNPVPKKKTAQTPIKLTQDVHANSVLSQKIGSVPFEEEGDLDVSFAKEKAILDGISLHFDSDSVELSKPISDYDKAVLNSIASCWEAGVREFTPQQLYSALFGKSTHGPSAKTLAEITESIEKLRRTRVWLDCTEEFEKRKVKIDGEEIKSAVFNDYMLSARAIKMKTLNGRRVDAYEINAAPLLYVHDKAVKQLLRFPHSLLESIGSEIRGTKTNLLLRDYVISRVLQCCKKSGAELLEIPEKFRPKYRRIRLDSILQAADLSKDTYGKSWSTVKRRATATIRLLFQKLYEANIIDEWHEIDEDGNSISEFNRETGMAEKFASARTRPIYAINIVTYDDAQERIRRELMPEKEQ